MEKIVKGIYSDVSLGTFLGFKGGTALYMLYKLPRFSVDLDFDLLNEDKKEFVFSKVSKIAEKFGIVTQAQDKHFNLFWLVSYGKGFRHVKIEISKRAFGSKYEVKNYLGTPVQVMKREDMFANKFAALLGRKNFANRDIFDIWYMLDQNWDINEELLTDRVDQESTIYLKQCLRVLEQYRSAKILAGLGELVDNKTKAWIKNKLLDETIFLLKVRLDNNLS